VITDELLPGVVFGSYRVERLVGSGEMGSVYAATHVQLNKRVALKILAGPLAREPVLVERFLREGRASARVRHDHIIEVFDVGVVQDLPYLAMEFLEGELLAGFYARGVVAPADLVGIMLPVVAAVATAHDQGVIHRDLKPDNIFLRRDSRGRLQPVVLDFGLSKIAEEGHLKLTETNALLGTPYYMSPEQAYDAKRVTPATDQYALGVIMYEGAAGRRPFEGNTLLEVFRRITSGVYRPLSGPGDGFLDRLGRVIGRAMSRQADARYPNLWALGRDLVQLGSSHDQESWRATFER
jgi:serine/threonine-protein kinase